MGTTAMARESETGGKESSMAGILFAGTITAMAGFVDGVGFVHFGGYFLSFMSGNSTRSSAALMTGEFAGWALAMSLVGCFVGGVILATLLTLRLEKLRRRRRWVHSHPGIR